MECRGGPSLDYLDFSVGEPEHPFVLLLLLLLVIVSLLLTR